MASNLDWDSIKEIRILPRHGCFYTEFVYEMKTQSAKLDAGQALSIDQRIGFKAPSFQDGFFCQLVVIFWLLMLKSNWF